MGVSENKRRESVCKEKRIEKERKNIGKGIEEADERKRWRREREE